MLKVTDSAAGQLRELLTDRPEAGAGLRVLVEKGGCAGLQYAMKIDRPAAGDEVVEKDGLIFMVDAASAPYLKDSEVDFVDTLADRGFKIHNPNAARSCGCGSSFEPAAAGPIQPASPLPDDQSCGEAD